MDSQTLWIVAVLSAGTLIGTFIRMKGGFGPMNLRAVGIVLIAALASLLAIGKSENLTAAMGILGAIAGYLFGAKSSKSEEDEASGSVGVNAQRARFGDNAKVAGRDINETVNNIERMLGDVQGLANATIKNLQLLQSSQGRPTLKRQRRESIRWEPTDNRMGARLKAVRQNDNWTQDWIDICLEDPDCLNAISNLIIEHSHSGWQAAEIAFDNTAEGLHVGVTFERVIDIPGL